MGWIFFAVGAVAVTLIAFVAIGQVVGRLATERPPAVYDINDAAMWIGDRLPEEVTARLSYDDVGLVLGWHLDWFNEVGVSSRYGQELAGEEVRREGAIAPEDGAIDAVVARSLAAGGPDAVDVVCILDLQLAYLRAIGAVGDAVED
jgi:hypothetical protein